VFKGWRDELATRSKRQADYAWAVLARILSVAKDRVKIKTIPVVGPLKGALDAEKARKRGLLVLLTKGGQKWTEHGFRSSWRKACEKAGISGFTFHDLRGTAVHRLALAECTEVEISIFTGLSLSGGRAMRRSLRAPARSSPSGRKGTKTPNRPPNYASNRVSRVEDGNEKS
jgi:hypothetical protein